MIQDLKLFNRIITNCIPDAETGCWVWQRCKISDGYGLVRRNGKQQLVHRVLYELVIGSIPEGLELDHLCSNRACVNPTHLEAVSHQENVTRWSKKQTHCRRGHEYTPINTAYQAKSGYRYCRTCHRMSRQKGKV